MKYFWLTVALLLLYPSSSQAIIFTHQIFLHRVDKETRVEVFSDIHELDRRNLTMQEAVNFVKTTENRRGANYAWILATGDCDSEKYRPLLQAMLSSQYPCKWELQYFEVSYPAGSPLKEEFMKKIKEAGITVPLP